MQTIDGDEFIDDKECIRLLYCNKSKWGDIEHHYDLMHPIPQHTCTHKAYDIIRESEHIIFGQTKKVQLEEQQRQT
eukprot:4816356-Heterocapsa_arctica.AAC.1